MADAPISELLSNGRKPLLSFEFFPPKDDAAMENLKRTASQLLTARPDFVTCTYGAGGSTRRRTLEVCGLLREMGFGPVMPHLTCVGSSRSDLIQVADEMYDLGYRNIMTLRGDPPRGDAAFRPAPDGLSHATELVQLLKTRHSDFCLGVACYPESHPEAISPEADITHLKEKINAGGSFATTQLFFDNKVYYRFIEKCRAAGVETTVVPGLLPVISLRQVQRMSSMCRASLPPALVSELEAAGGEGEAAEEVGVRWVTAQIRDLIEHAVPCIHLYILNRSRAALSADLLKTLRRI
jgi:methylenetetrahydrofolate reductase (NADPH)